MRCSSRRGFTLTELMIVMGVMGSVLGAIWFAAGNTHEAQKEGDAFSEMQTVVKNIYDLMQGQSLAVANDTSSFITAGAVPSIYINGQNAAKADNPWSPANFFIYGLTTKTFRVTFYNVTRQGCLSLLLQGTACQNGQSYCPTGVHTGGTVGGATSTPTSPACVAGSCNGTVSAALGWQVMGSTAAAALCGTAYNSYSGGAKNSVEFDYAL